MIRCEQRRARGKQGQLNLEPQKVSSCRTVESRCHRSRLCRPAGRRRFRRAGTPVIGFDIDAARIAELQAGRDRTREVEPDDLGHPSLRFTSDPAETLRRGLLHRDGADADRQARRPDLSALTAASETVGEAAEAAATSSSTNSTVYPGATEEDCVPVLEQASGLAAGRDFTVGYSPERINPGDKAHRFETITKVVSGQDARTLEIVAAVYGSVVTAGIHRAPSIKVAEAAKVIENTQRDLNIAFMNELSAIFHELGIDTSDVLAAAAHQMEFPAILLPASSAGTASASIPITSLIVPRRPAIIRR